MDDNIRKNLDIILKNGDLYDAIARKEGVQPRRFFWEINIFFISRILFACTFVTEKILERFTQNKNISRIEKVRKAQNQIRQKLGVSVDIIHLKKFGDFYDLFDFKKGLGLLYQEDGVELEKYIHNLKKIANFCESYHINEIFISKNDLEQYAIENDYLKDTIDIFDTVGVSEIFRLPSIRVKTTQEKFLRLDPETLLCVIEDLELTKIDKNKILELGNRVQDIQIQNAVEKFIRLGDLENLKIVVKQRFTQYLNREGPDKDKVHGKVLKTIHVQDEYVSVTTTNQKGEIINHAIMSIYEYLDVPNDSSLFNQLNQIKDNQQILQMAALHLYLCNQEKCNVINEVKKESFLDRLYHDYQAKSQGKIKKIPHMRTKLGKWIHNGSTLYVSNIISLVLIIFGILTGISVEWAQHFLFGKEGNFSVKEVVSRIVNYIDAPQLDKNIINAIEEKLEDFNLDFTDVTKAFAGDVSFTHHNKEIIGTVESLNTQYGLPSYYATGYATSATYQGGKVEYTICQPLVSFEDIENVGELFQVKYDMRKRDLKKSIENSEINLSQMLYPVGVPYAITRIDIIDKEDTSKHFAVDYQRASIQGNTITKAEEELLLKMKKPEVCYTYGIGQSQFISSLQKESSYTNLSYDEIIDSITRGLGLDNYDPITVYAAIKSKSYSKTPIKDAGLSRKIKKMDEEEYYEAIASMDSLVCNLAATLIVEVYDDTVYVVGYQKDSHSKTIKTEDAHAWAMNNNGRIIDATPSISVEKEAKTILEEVINWGIENHIPLYILMTIIAVTLQKKFGKKITTTIKIEKVRSILETENIEEAYAKIGEVLYGGIYIPKERGTSEFVQTIANEFSSFSIEELKELKKEIKENEENSQTTKNAIHLINEIPYIREHSEDLQKVFTNQKNV